MPTIVPNLWFDTEGLEAAEFYVSIFPNSRITSVMHYGAGAPRPAGEVLSVSFELDGQPFTAINGGPQFEFDEAVSFNIECADQAEIDRYWDLLTAAGGEESQCGWCKDRYGLSWQVNPAGWETKLRGLDQAAADRVMAALYQMRKLDIAALDAAAEG